MIATLGGAEEESLVLGEALREAGPQPARAESLLAALEDASLRGRPAPVNALGILVLLDSRDAALAAAAARLTGEWKLTAAGHRLGQIAADRNAAEPLRQAAAGGLSLLGNAEAMRTLAELSDRRQPLSVRKTALAARASVDAQAAAPQVVELLGEMSAGDDPSLLFTALFLEQERGGGSDVGTGQAEAQHPRRGRGRASGPHSGRDLPELIAALFRGRFALSGRRAALAGSHGRAVVRGRVAQAIRTAAK